SYLCGMGPLYRYLTCRRREDDQPRRRGASCRRLAPQAELLDQGPIAGVVLALQVPEVPAALADQLEQAAPRAVVLLVDFDVLDELVDAGRDQRDLHLGRPGVTLVGRRPLDDLGFFLFGQRHLGPGLL